MGFGQLIIQCQSLQYGHLRLASAIFRRRERIIGDRTERICQAHVSERIARVRVNCFLEVLHACLERPFCSHVPKVAAAQIQLIRFRLLGGAPGNALLDLRGKSRLKLVRDGPGDFHLYRQKVGKLPVVLFAPELQAGFQLNEIRVNEQGVAALLNLPGQHRAHRQLTLELL